MPPPWLPKQLTSNLPIPKEVLWLEVQVNLYNMWTPMGKFVVKAFSKNFLVCLLIGQNVQKNSKILNFENLKK